MTGTDSKEREVVREIASLAALNRESLLRRWRNIYGTPPPDKLSRALLEKALAYEIQCAVFGGLSSATRRVLRAAASAQVKTRSIRPVGRGARLVREWNGVVHQVDATEDGYIWQDQTYTRAATWGTGSDRGSPKLPGSMNRWPEQARQPSSRS